MDESKKRDLLAAGIDVDGALARLMGNETLFLRLLQKFLADKNYAKLVNALETGDAEAALAASHTLKGVCGNLSMTALFDLLTRQVAALRAGQWQEAVDMLAQIAPAYERVSGAIRGL
ncbi:MAG TPA: Hpt domain-containing protein [Candidatus Pullichristensenella stercorigallinarum]|uniref:Hpt domain-containing protein n=1 Tax=Candidatus Pullichristensenella stercorigallinarum TaxID=2840909 RepID=A0A9D1CY27_9FIRM|nr:Hpt domain-containing protein [Candidatus Pullichristensenella stercorigallinarum]